MDTSWKSILDPASVDITCPPEHTEWQDARVLDAVRQTDRLELRKPTEADRPVFERLIGYSGVAWFEFEGRRRLEFGWRLTPETRGVGYATEAGVALLQLATESLDGEILAMIDPTNEPSKRVAGKLGFEFWKLAEVGGNLDEIHRIQVSRRDAEGVAE